MVAYGVTCLLDISQSACIVINRLAAQSELYAAFTAHFRDRFNGLHCRSPARWIQLLPAGYGCC
jgi:hypothetical protein